MGPSAVGRVAAPLLRLGDRFHFPCGTDSCEASQRAGLIFIAQARVQDGTEGWVSKGFKTENGHVVALGLSEDFGWREQENIILPETIDALKFLRILFLENNRMTALPETIGNLLNLQVLRIFRNDLTPLPYSIGQLQSLTVLNVYGNRLTTLVEEIGNLSTLESLNLYDNQLTTLPESIGKLAKLRNLELSRYEETYHKT